MGAKLKDSVQFVMGKRERAGVVRKYVNGTILSIKDRYNLMIRTVESHVYKYSNRWLMLKRMRGRTLCSILGIVAGLLVHSSAYTQFTKYSNEFLNIGAG